MNITRNSVKTRENCVLGMCRNDGENAGVVRRFGLMQINRLCRRLACRAWLYSKHFDLGPGGESGRGGGRLTAALLLLGQGS